MTFPATAREVCAALLGCLVPSLRWGLWTKATPTLRPPRSPHSVITQQTERVGKEIFEDGNLEIGLQMSLLGPFLSCFSNARCHAAASMPGFPGRNGAFWPQRLGKKPPFISEFCRMFALGRLFTGAWCELAMGAGMRFLSIRASLF